MTQDRMHKPRSRWELLTQTDTGTPMGDLLRRYWWPIAGASELDRPGTKPVRLLGEDLVLYRERPYLPLADLEQLGGAGEEAYRQMLATEHFTPHTRLDVAFTSL